MLQYNKILSKILLFIFISSFCYGQTVAMLGERQYPITSKIYGEGTTTLNGSGYNIFTSWYIDTSTFNYVVTPSDGWSLYAMRDSVRIDSNNTVITMTEEYNINPRFIADLDPLYRVALVADIDFTSHNQEVKDWFKIGYESAGGTWEDSVFIVDETGSSYVELYNCDTAGVAMIIRPQEGINLTRYAQYYPTVSIIAHSNSTSDVWDFIEDGLPPSISVAFSNADSNQQYWDVEFLIDTNGLGLTNASNTIGYFGGQMLFVMDSLGVNGWTARYLFREEREYSGVNGYGVARIDSALANYDAGFNYDSLDIYKYDSIYP